MYGKFFASAFTGSMMAAGAEVFAVWGYVIANTVNSHVELNPKLLAALIGSTPDRMQAAIDMLCSPDQNSRSKASDGRRLVRDGEYQYFVVNHQQYREVRDEEGRREYNRLAKQRERERNKSKQVNSSVNDSQQRQPKSAQAEAEAEASTSTTVAKAAPSPCPHVEIIALYAKHLPACRQPDVSLWNGTRAQHLQARWREKPERQNLEWWDKFFGYIAESDFLTGRVASNAGRKPFLLSIDWIIKSENFVKIHEGAYR